MNNEQRNQLLRNVTNKKNAHLLIIGNFNYKDIDWKLQKSAIGIEHDTTHFLETINDCYFFQHIRNKSTRYRDGNKSTLDLILTNEKVMVNDTVCYSENKPDESVPRYIYIIKQIMSSFEE